MQIHPTATIDEGAQLDTSAAIWHYSHVCTGATIGKQVSIGQNCFIASEVVVGEGCKLQNNISLYMGVTLEPYVFLGPSCVLTNVTNPRAEIKRQSLYEKTLIRRGASVGANATIVCGITLGRYCFIGAGAVVSEDVPDYALILGVPGKQAGWMSRHGHKLSFNEQGEATCPESGFRYGLDKESNTVCCLDVNEDQNLPDDQREGGKGYNELKGN